MADIKRTAQEVRFLGRGKRNRGVHKGGLPHPETSAGQRSHRVGAVVLVEASAAAHRSALSTAVKESQSLAITLGDATSARRGQQGDET